MSKKLVGVVAVVLAVTAGRFVTTLQAQPAVDERPAAETQDKTLLSPAQAPLRHSSDDVESYLEMVRADLAAKADAELNQELVKLRNERELLAAQIKVLEARLKERRRKNIAGGDRTGAAASRDVTPATAADRTADSGAAIEGHWKEAKEAERTARMQLDTIRLKANALRLQAQAEELRNRAETRPADPLGPVPLIAGGDEPTAPPVLPNGNVPQPVTAPVALPWFPPPHPVKWEYKVSITSGPLQEHELNEIGAQRWELVQVMTKEDYAFHTLFKRPKQ